MGGKTQIPPQMQLSIDKFYLFFLTAGTWPNSLIKIDQILKTLFRGPCI